jgi:hypothetical protein
VLASVRGADAVTHVAAERLNNDAPADLDLAAPGNAAAAPVTASIYQLDGIVRRATSLQLTADARGRHAATGVRPGRIPRWKRWRHDRFDLQLRPGPDRGPWWTAGGWPVIWTLIKIICVLAPLMGAVAYLTLWERKAASASSQIRHGPNRVGPFGLLQPIADALKLLTKEIISPTAASKGLFRLGPIMTIMPALAAWVVIPFGPEASLANVNAGLLLIMAITSIEVYGVIIAGWASNSKYAFLGALRASAQMVSYEIAMGFCLVVVI